MSSALIDGIVMGGGVGLFAHASHRVVSERCLFAMPEVGIGFFPDVGAAYVLARLPNRIGALLAATGRRIEAGDVVELGIAQTFVPSSDLPALTAALAEAGPLDAILGRFAAPPPPGKLAAEGAAIQTWFARLDRPAVAGGAGQGGARAPSSPRPRWRRCARLRRRPRRSPCARSRSPPTSASRKRCGSISASPRASAAAEDMYEGVRATIVDKDHAPRWRPGPGEPIAEAAIDAYFAPLPPAEELTFPEPARR